jgi:hypothetical protein
MRPPARPRWRSLALSRPGVQGREACRAPGTSVGPAVLVRETGGEMLAMATRLAGRRETAGRAWQTKQGMGPRSIPEYLPGDDQRRLPSHLLDQSDEALSFGPDWLNEPHGAFHPDEPRPGGRPFRSRH